MIKDKILNEIVSSLLKISKNIRSGIEKMHLEPDYQGKCYIQIYYICYYVKVCNKLQIAAGNNVDVSKKKIGKMDKEAAGLHPIRYYE